MITESRFKKNILSQRIKLASKLIVLGSAVAVMPMLAAQDANKTGTSSILDFEEVIVTATRKGQTLFDVSYAATLMSEDVIHAAAPLNTADLVGLSPGIFTESTGGDVQNVYRVRAIPNEGSAISFQEDGVAITGLPQGFFVGPDVMMRVDIMTESFDVVRGGPTPIYADNAIAMFNNISRRGDDEDKGAVRVTAGDIGLGRVDGFWAGAVGERTYLALGGFMRTSDGNRNNGYTADHGGQFRFNLTRVFDYGSFNIYGRYLDDSNTFYLPIPISDATTGESYADLIDPLTGTLNNEYMQGVTIRASDGEGGTQLINRDLSDGRRAEAVVFGFEFETEVSDTWHISNKFLHSSMHVSMDALYSTSAPQNADDFAASKLAAAQAAWGSGVTALDYQYAITGGVYDPSTAGNLVVQGQYRAVENDFSNIVNDFRASGLLGDHELTLGVLGGLFDETAERYQSQYLFEMASRPQPIDLIARDAAGDQLGSVTDGGVLAHATTAHAGTAEARRFALYASDNWSVTDRLRLEAGVRYQSTSYKGGRWGGVSGVDLGDATTLADDSVRGITSDFTPSSHDLSTTSWTFGANYDLRDDLGVYARASRSYYINEMFAASGTGEINDTEVTQYEVGVKYNSAMLAVFATAFYAEFDPITQNIKTVNSAGIEVEESFTGLATSPGIEFLAVLTPASGFTVTTNLTYNKPELADLTSNLSGSTAVAPDGNVVRRQPELYGYISPEFSFDFAGADVTANLRYNFVGERFVDYNNSTALPAYETLSAALTMDWDEWQLQLSGDNLTDEFGLTEGNPRNDVISGQGTPVANYGRPIFGRSFRLSATYNF